MQVERSFGDWLRQRRRTLDLTQDELARQVGCSAITLRKLEAEERRPSKQIAERLAEVLQVALEDRPAFLRFARGDPFAAPSAAITESVKHGGNTPARSHNLPIQLTSFIGREKEIAEIKRLITANHLITLTGAGGSGKTRLAQQVAADLLAVFPDGMWLVELAPLADPALVPQTVASVLGIKEEVGRPLLATLTNYLRNKTTLLVLDNCEHLIAASAQLAEAVLQTCPDIRLLATSREALSIAGETTFPVPSLSLPSDFRNLKDFGSLAQYEAVRLFVDRAATALPDFVLTNANAPAVAQVCHQLDGIPRAALTWSKSAVGSAEIGLRLAGAMWSFWDYRGYWNEGRGWLESALAHADTEGMGYAHAQVLHALGNVLAYQGDYATGEARMTQSLRLYQELGDLPASADALNRLGWLAREQGDATTARLRLEESLALFRELGDQSGIASALVAMGEVAVMQEDVAWATALLEEALAMFQELEDLQGMGWVFNHLGHVAQLRGEYERARRLHEDSLRLFRALSEQYPGIAEAYHSLGETALAQGDATLATTRFTEALALFRDLGYRSGVSWCLAGLAGVAAVDEEPECAARLWGAAEALRQAIRAREAPASRATRERLITLARAQLGEAAFNAEWAKGQAMTVEQAIAEALRAYK